MLTFSSQSQRLPPKKKKEQNCLLQNIGNMANGSFDIGFNLRRKLKWDSSSRPHQETWGDKDKGGSSIKT